MILSSGDTCVLLMSICLFTQVYPHRHAPGTLFCSFWGESHSFSLGKARLEGEQVMGVATECHPQGLRETRANVSEFVTSASENLRLWLASWRASLIGEQGLGGTGLCAACKEGCNGAVAGGGGMTHWNGPMWTIPLHGPGHKGLTNRAGHTSILCLWMSTYQAGWYPPYVYLTSQDRTRPKANDPCVSWSPILMGLEPSLSYPICCLHPVSPFPRIELSLDPALNFPCNFSVLNAVSCQMQTLLVSCQFPLFKA